MPTVRRKELSKLLTEWYGREDAAGQMLPHLPEPVSLDIALDRIVRTKIAAGQLKIAAIQSQWVDMVGPDNARRAHPVRLKEGVLEIEVRHPAYQRALDTPVIRDMILKKAQELAGATYCREIRFCPFGSARR